MRASNCQFYARFIHAYADNELDVSQQLIVEQHIGECPSCAAFLHNTRNQKLHVRAAVVAIRTPDALRSRISETMVQTKRGDTAATSTHSLLSWRIAGPLAAAAALSIVFASVSNYQRQPLSSDTDHVSSNASMAAGVPVDSFLDDLIEQHVNPLPPETTNPSDVRRFDPFVGVPVRAPVLSTVRGEWIGGRVVPMRHHRAVILQYRIDGDRRVSVYVFDPRKLRAFHSSKLRSHVVNNASIYAGYVRGFSVAMTDRRGVGYAVASDLDEDQSSKLVAAVNP